MSAEATQVRRFERSQRVEHALLLLSFTVLSITGLPQKWSTSDWGSAMIWLMGGIELVRIIHRMAATLLMAQTIYHAVIVSYKVIVKRVRMSMLPGWQDVKDGLQALGYNLGLLKTPPAMGRYNFGEKVEYWAVIWGTVIMIITGFMLWNPIATVRFLPGEFIPAAKAAHGGEALLAVLSILTWHAYHVHIKHFNKSMFTGYLSRHAMEEEHSLELEEMAAGRTMDVVDPEMVMRRRRVFVPIAAVVSLVMLVGLYFFVTFEHTAITTVPREAIDVFVPLAPTPTVAP